MPLRALKTDEEIAAHPLDRPILIELPGGVEVPDTDGKKPELDDGAKALQDQLEALKTANKATEERERLANERTAKAERDAVQARREADDERKRTAALEGDVITGGLAAAQSERDSAKQALQVAGEAGDWKSIADAQSRIGRAEAKILTFESGAAEVASRKEPEPRREQQQQQQQPRTFEEGVHANRDLLQSEREWMIKNKSSFDDPDFNKRLDFGWKGAMQLGLVRGSPEYFDHMEKASGLKAADGDERTTNVQAPPSRNERGVDGRSTPGKVTLSPEQREAARSMGVSEIDYAKNLVKFQAAQAADPDRYSNRG